MFELHKIYLANCKPLRFKVLLPFIYHFATQFSSLKYSLASSSSIVIPFRATAYIVSTAYLTARVSAQEKMAYHTKMNSYIPCKNVLTKHI